MRRRAGAVSHPPSSSPPAAPRPVSPLHSGDSAAIRRDTPAPMGDFGPALGAGTSAGGTGSAAGLPAQEFFMPLFGEWERQPSSALLWRSVINVRSESRTRPVSAAAEQPCQFVEAREPPSPQAGSCPGFWKGLGDGGQAVQTCCAGALREAALSGDSVCAQARGWLRCLRGLVG